MRNTLKDLEFRMFHHTPSKRIYLDTDNSMALNNLHLSPVVPPTPESHIPDAKYEKMLPVFIDNETSNHSQEQTCESKENQQFFVELQPVRSSNNKEQVVLSESCLPLVTSKSVVVEHSMETTTENNTFFPTTAQLCSTESLEKSAKYSAFTDTEFQTLLNCSLDQYSLKDPLSKSSSQTHPPIDELDNIMQVLVSM